MDLQLTDDRYLTLNAECDAAFKILLIIQSVVCGGLAFGYWFLALQTGNEDSQFILIGSCIGWSLISISICISLVVAWSKPKHVFTTTWVTFSSPLLGFANIFRLLVP